MSQLRMSLHGENSYLRNEVVAFSHLQVPYYQVVFRGVLQRPAFAERGPAVAYLDLLVKGVKKPEPVR
jgi:hypothetical protein